MVEIQESNAAERLATVDHGADGDGDSRREQRRSAGRSGRNTRLWRATRWLIGRFRRSILGIVGVCSLLGIWALIVAVWRIEPLYLPSPPSVWDAFVEYVGSDQFTADIAISSQEYGLGFALAVGLGVSVGFLVGVSSTIRQLLQPIIDFAMATPYIAIFPLLVVWFGIGITAKVLVVAYAGFFPIVINTAAGVRGVDSELVRMARAYLASRSRILFTVAVPSAVPFIVAGVRMAVARGITAVVVAELIASQAGVGYTIASAGATYQTPRLLAVVILIAGTALVLNIGVDRLERYFLRWKT